MDIRGYEKESFVRQLCSDIRYTRIKNMNGDYSVYIMYKDESGKKAYILKEDKKEIRKVVLPNGVNIENNLEKIQFNPGRGSLNDKGETIKIVDNKRKDFKVITIVPFSGRTLIREGAYKYE